MNRKLSLALVAALAVLFVVPNPGSGQSSRKGYLGVYSQKVSRKIIKKYNLPIDYGVYITGIVENSPAEDAGLEEKDVLTKFGSESLYDEQDLTDAVRKSTPDSDVSVELYRRGEKKTVTVKVGKLKSSGNSYSYSYNNNGHGLRWLGNLFSDGVHNSRPRGVEAQNLTRQLGEYFGVPNGRGVLITEVKKGGVVDKAGFKAGDVVTKIDSHSVDEVDELIEIINDREGKTIDVEIVRGGKPSTLSIKIPDEEEDWY